MIRKRGNRYKENLLMIRMIAEWEYVDKTNKVKASFQSLERPLTEGKSIFRPLSISLLVPNDTPEEHIITSFHLNALGSHQEHLLFSRNTCRMKGEKHELLRETMNLKYIRK